PLNLFDGVFHIVQEDLGNPGSSAGSIGTKLREPAIMRHHSGPSSLVFLRGPRTGGRYGSRRIKGRNCVWKQNFGDYALGLEHLGPLGALPIDRIRERGRSHLPLGGIQLTPAIDEARCPVVELVPIPRIKVAAVIVEISPCVSVRRDNDVLLR